MAFKLQGGAGAWWHRHQEERRLKGEPRVNRWPQMIALLKARFQPAEHEQMLFIQFQNCTKGSRTVDEYTEEFLRLQVRCNLAETEDQQVARYLNGLNDLIQDRLMLHELAEVLGAPNREGRCGKVWWEYKQAWTEEVDERPPGCVVILNPEKRAHILRKARHAKVPIIALVDPVFLSDPKLHRDKRINHPIPVEGTEQLSGLISDLIYPKT